MFHYDHVPEKELQQGILLKAGVADFEIVNVQEKTSQNTGNEMLELKLRVWDEDGAEGVVYDYIISSEKTIWKLYQLSKALSGIKIYSEDGCFDPNKLIGQKGKLILKITAPSGEYPARNQVKSYCEFEVAVPEFSKEEIPF